MDDDTATDRRTIAACEGCGSLYAALEFDDETLRPIGRRDGCQCGCTEFARVDGSLSEEPIDGGVGRAR